MGYLTLYVIDRLARARGRGNAARTAMRPIIDGLVSARPRILAQNGDSGRGVANTQPWYQVHLAVDRTPDPEELVTWSASNAGYELEVDRGSRSLIAESEGRTLRVSITDRGAMPDRAIVSLTLTLPDLT